MDVLRLSPRRMAFLGRGCQKALGRDEAKGDVESGSWRGGVEVAWKGGGGQTVDVVC